MASGTDNLPSADPNSPQVVSRTEIFSDYFTCAVRTGGPVAAIERWLPFQIAQIVTDYSLVFYLSCYSG